MSTSALADLASRSSALLAKRLTADARSTAQSPRPKRDDPYVAVEVDSGPSTSAIVEIATISISEMLSDGRARLASLREVARMNSMSPKRAKKTAGKTGSLVKLGGRYYVDRLRFRVLA